MTTSTSNVIPITRRDRVDEQSIRRDERIRAFRYVAGFIGRYSGQMLDPTVAAISGALYRMAEDLEEL